MIMAPQKPLRSLMYTPIGAGGSFSGSVQEASLVSPAISVPESEFPSSHLRCGCAGTQQFPREIRTAGP